MRNSCTLLVLTFAVGCGPSAQQPEPTGVNVLVVSFDALRADALGVYGNPRKISPNIDDFAQEAIVFDMAYSAAPVTPTSFAGLWSGQLPHRVFRGWKFNPDKTLGELFSEGGYHTAAFVNNVNLTESRNFQRGFSEYHWQPVHDRKVLGVGMKWLQQNSHKKFFLWLHFISPHAPYDRLEIAEHLYEADYDGRFQKTTGVRFETEDPHEVSRIRSLYDGEVFFADKLFGQLWAELKRLGRTEDTMFVLTSDHGEEFKEHGGFQHGALYEEHIRVPLLIFLPEGSGGQRVTQLVSHLDLLPTLAEIAGLKAPPGLDGASLFEPVQEERLIVSEAMTSSEYLAIAARRNREKLVVQCLPRRSLQYFDLSENPLEKNELERMESERARRMLSYLSFLLDNRPCSELRAATRGGNPKANLTPESVKELRALGYLE